MTMYQILPGDFGFNDIIDVNNFRLFVISVLLLIVCTVRP
jgi:hypothetical protein